MKVDLSTRATFEYPAVIGQEPTFGGDIIGWLPLATVWMELQDVLPSRAEAVKLGLTVAINQTRARYNYRTDVTSAMRIRVSGPVERVLQIVAGPAVLGEKEYSEVMCQAFA